MSEEESRKVDQTTEGSSKSSKKKVKRQKNKMQLPVTEGADAEEMKEVSITSQLGQSNLNSDGGNAKRKKKRKKSSKLCIEENFINAEVGEHDFKAENSSNEGIPYSNGVREENETSENKLTVVKDAPNERRDNIIGVSSVQKESLESYNGKTDKRVAKKKKQLLEEVAKAKMCGICYLSRVPPQMDPLKLRQILSQYGEIRRIYLLPEDSARQVQRKRAGGFRGQLFSEGWVEFADKRVAKKVANLLNGEQIGGKKRSSFYYDLWNIKYLSKFKWDDLVEETAYKNAVREQKLALEISAAKKERDFYLSKVDKSRALTSIEERLKKKQKVQEDSENNSGLPEDRKLPKVIRNFPQTKPIAATAVQNKQSLSKSILAGVFGSS